MRCFCKATRDCSVIPINTLTLGPRWGRPAASPSLDRPGAPRQGAAGPGRAPGGAQRPGTGEAPGGRRRETPPGAPAARGRPGLYLFIFFPTRGVVSVKGEHVEPPLGVTVRARAAGRVWL